MPSNGHRGFHRKGQRPKTEDRRWSNPICRHESREVPTWYNPSTTKSIPCERYNKLTSLLLQVDRVPVTRKQKLKLFHLGICPRLTWDLTISEFPVSWLEKNLDPLATSRSGQVWPEPRTQPGFSYHRPVEASTIRALPSWQNQPPDNLTGQRREPHSPQESKKEKSQIRAKFQPYLAALSAFAGDLGASSKVVTKRAKAKLQTELVERRLLSHRRRQRS